MDLNERIKIVRKKLDLTQKDFAEKIGSTQNVLANYEIGRRNPSNSVINNICKTFSVSEEWLRTGEGEMFNPAPSTALDALVEEYGLSADARVLVDKFVNLKPSAQEAILTYIKEVADALQSGRFSKSPVAFPVPTRLISYYYKNASAGTGQLIIDNLPEKDVEIPDLPQYQSVSYAIGVNGSSMEPTFHDGDILLVEATQEIHIGEIGIFQIGDECYVKELGDAELISLNDKYDNIPLDESARILGRVIDKIQI